MNFAANMDRIPCTDSESQLVDSSQTGTRFSKKVVAAVLAGAAILLAPVAIHLGQPALLHGSVDYVQSEAETFGPKMDSCSDETTSCLTSKCCKSTGFQCFKSGATAKCAAKCPGGSCEVLSPSYSSKAAWANGDSMYCYTLYASMAGPKKDSAKELAILKYQKGAGLGVFGCDASSVF